jgi:hypothetical protein
MKKKKKKKTVFFYQNYPMPFIGDDKTSASSTVGSKKGGALEAGKPNISK